MLLNTKENKKFGRKYTHPLSVETPQGNLIDISQETWRIPTSVGTKKILFGRLPLADISGELRDYGYERLSTMAESTSVFTLHVWTNHFPLFLKSKNYRRLDWKDLKIAHFEEYLTHLRSSGIGYYFWHLQTVVNWMQLNRPGLLCSKVAEEIASWTIEGNQKGIAVLFNDPYKGALTIEESDNIRSIALDFNSDATLLERFTVLLFLETGQRNEQLSKLEVKDFKKLRLSSTNLKSLFRYSILMPSNKFATGRKDFSITEDLFNLCLELAKNNQQYYGLFNSKPLLIIVPEINRLTPSRYEAHKERLKKIRICNSWDLNMLVKTFCLKCDVRDRFGTQIQLFARRFRRTIATRMVEQGASPEEVASILDHADIQQIMIYFEYHKHKKQQRLEDAAGSFFRSLDESIKGKLIANATKARNPDAVLPFFDEETQDLVGSANCGRDMEKVPVCEESQIHACYGCNHFQPYISDIHGKVLSQLEIRRENLIQIQGRDKGRIIDGVDKLITNVKKVVEAVKKIREGKN